MRKSMIVVTASPPARLFRERGRLDRRLRRLAEGIIDFAVPHQNARRLESKASRRDADWRRSRRPRSQRRP